MTQSISGTVTNLFTACRDTVFVSSTGTDNLPVLVSLGSPGKYNPNAIVAVAIDVRGPIGRPTMAPTRSREMDAEIDVLFSVFVPGDEDSQPIATAAAFALFAQLETYLRTKPNETLGGGCRDAWLSVGNLAQQIAWQASEDPASPPIPVGRVAALTAVVSAAIRY